MSWLVEIRNIGQNTAVDNGFNYEHKTFIEISFLFGRIFEDSNVKYFKITSFLIKILTVSCWEQLNTEYSYNLATFKSQNKIN